MEPSKSSRMGGPQIALMASCLVDAWFPNVGKAMAGLMRRLGHELLFPPAQTCCGQVLINTGYEREAVELVRNHTTTFEPYDLILGASSSCVGSVRYHHLGIAQRAGDAGLARRVSALAEKTYELSELLVDQLLIEDVGATFPHRVTYHPTCHSLRLLKVDSKPVRLLSNVRGMQLVPLPSAEECCGFGGTFAIKNPDVSTAMLADKMRHTLGTGAEMVTAGDMSCLMHLGGGLSRLRSGTRAIHLAEILASTG